MRVRAVHESEESCARPGEAHPAPLHRLRLGARRRAAAQPPDVSGFWVLEMLDFEFLEYYGRKKDKQLLIVSIINS